MQIGEIMSSKDKTHHASKSATLGISHITAASAAAKLVLLLYQYTAAMSLVI